MFGNKGEEEGGLGTWGREGERERGREVEKERRREGERSVRRNCGWIFRGKERRKKPCR